MKNTELRQHLADTEPSLGPNGTDTVVECVALVLVGEGDTEVESDGTTAEQVVDAFGLNAEDWKEEA